MLMRRLLISLGTGLSFLLTGLSVVTTTAAEPIISGYTDYANLEKRVKAIVTKDVATVESLTATLGKRDVWLITIGTGKTEEKPALLVMGNVHAPHLVGSELALRFAEKLVEQAKTDEAVKKLIAKYTFYVIPRPTPDASEAFFTKPYLERAGNFRPTDDDRDGSLNEDLPEDLNGDGVITLMRVADPSGGYREHPLDPRVMIAVDPKKDERGTHTLYPEGRDRDGDEQFAEDGPGGVDFNRNFTFKYPFFKKGAGPHQVSELETRAVADFCFDHPNIVAVFTFTPEDNLLSPWKPGQETGRIKTTISGGDAPYFEFLADKYRGVLAAKDAPNSPAGEGSFSEWAYYHFGRWSLAARGWWVPKVAEKTPEEKPGEGKPEDKAKSEDKAKAVGSRGADELNALRWFAQEKIDGFVPWTSYEHPDLPGKKVEIGGIKPFFLLNPPARELDALANKHFEYLRDLPKLFPEISVSETKVESLGGGIFRVTATVVNTGYFPTMSEMGRTARQVYPLQIKLETPPRIAFVKGSPRTELERLSGNGGKTQHSWLIRKLDDESVLGKIKVYSKSVGSAEAAVEIKAEPKADVKK